MNHPLYTAREIADAILQDPIAARQVKEYINPDSLRLLLEIELTKDELDELVTIRQFTDDDILAEFEDRLGYLDNEHEEAFELLRKQWEERAK